MYYLYDIILQNMTKVVRSYIYSIDQLNFTRVLYSLFNYYYFKLNYLAHRQQMFVTFITIKHLIYV